MDPFGNIYGSGGFGGFGQMGEENPQLGYAAYLDYFQPQSSMYDWLSRNYNKFYNRYQGQYMNQLSSGQQTGSWANYLKEFNPAQEFAYTHPRERGEHPGAYGGRTRTIW